MLMFTADVVCQCACVVSLSSASRVPAPTDIWQYVTLGLDITLVMLLPLVHVGHVGHQSQDVE